MFSPSTASKQHCRSNRKRGQKFETGTNRRFHVRSAARSGIRFLRQSLLICVLALPAGCVESPNAAETTVGNSDSAPQRDEPKELPEALPAEQTRILREHFPGYVLPLPEPHAKVELPTKATPRLPQPLKIDGQPLATAICQGNVSVARELIGSPESRDATYDGYNMLHMAAQRGQTEICAMLVDAGLDIEQAHNNEYSAPRTPVQLAIQCGSVATAELLVQRGAKLTPARQSKDVAGQTISLASLAVGSQKAAMLKFVKEQSAPVEDNQLVLNAISGTTDRGQRLKMVTQLFGAGLSLDGLSGPFVWALCAGDLPLLKLLETKATPSYGEEHVKTALQTGKIEICHHVVSNGGRLSSKSPHQDLMRMALIDHRSPELVDLIVEAGGKKLYCEQSEACTSYCNRHDFADPLYHAVMENDLEFCRSLIREFPDDKGLWAALKYEPYEYENDIEFFQKGNSILFSAVFEDNAEALKLLLKYTQQRSPKEQSLVDINAQNQAGNTVLHEAVNFGAVRCVQLLLAAGADVSITRNDGSTPMQNATRYHQMPHMYSHERMEEPASRIFPLLVAANMARSDDDWINAKTSGGTTVLHSLAAAGYPKICRKLIDLGADVNAIDQHQRTPLHSAIGGSHEFHPEDVQQSYSETCLILLQNGTNAKQKDSPVHLNYLRHAASKRLYAVFDELLARGAEKNIAVHGGPLLCSAARHSNPSRVKQLLEWGADVNARGHEDSTALHHAARQKDLQMCQLLIDNGADVNALDQRGQTPLFEVFDRWALHLERFLVASPSETQTKAFAVLQLLLRHGADPTVKTKSTTSTSFSGTVLEVFRNMPKEFRDALTAQR